MGLSWKILLVRRPATRMNACERPDATLSIDAAQVLAQHERYATLLARTGAKVHVLPALETHPDCVFIEDVAVVLSPQRLLMTRPGAPSRRGEVASVTKMFRALGYRTDTVEAPGCLDGGDVLRFDQHIFVGLSSRSNAAGIEQLRTLAAEEGLHVSPVPVGQGLHLKSACSLAAPGLLLVQKGAFDTETLNVFEQSGLECLTVPENESEAANVLAMPNGAVMIPANCPKTLAMLQKRGLHVIDVDLSEAAKADGAITCQSIRLPEAGDWAT